jgi:hypothetical protein
MLSMCLAHHPSTLTEPARKALHCTHKQLRCSVLQNPREMQLTNRYADTAGITPLLRTPPFRNLMKLCSCTLQSLEHEKRLIQGMPLEELDALQARRHAAATKIQACWRGAQQRQQLRLTIPALVSSCTSCCADMYALWYCHSQAYSACQSCRIHGWRQNSSGSKVHPHCSCLSSAMPSGCAQTAAT